MKTVQYILSALTAFTIAAGGSLLAVLGSGYKLNTESWVISVITGAMAASKDIRSLMRMPPVSNGDTQFLVKPTVEPPTK